jgi:hypothetical protein
VDDETLGALHADCMEAARVGRSIALAIGGALLERREAMSATAWRRWLFHGPVPRPALLEYLHRAEAHARRRVEEELRQDWSP